MNTWTTKTKEYLTGDNFVGSATARRRPNPLLPHAEVSSVALTINIPRNPDLERDLLATKLDLLYWYCTAGPGRRERTNLREQCFLVPVKSEETTTRFFVKMATESLPYSLKNLTWDAAHQFNSQNRYGYTGKCRKLSDAVMQCEVCDQWFHLKEVRLSPSKAVPSYRMHRRPFAV